MQPSSQLYNDYEKLNKEQKEIINKFAPNTLIVAGPGTGKTRTISVLIAKQLEQDIKLKEILALTFSEKAATELKERVLQYYPQSFGQCWISTFHSFCSRILREQYHEVQIAPDFKLLNAFKESLLISFICKKLDPLSFSEYGKVLLKRGFQQEILTFISLLKSNQITPNDFKTAIDTEHKLSIRTKQKCYEILHIYRQYEKERCNGNYLDYRDLVSLTIKVLTNEQIATNYRSKFKVILVDEFQDTDPAQFLLLTLLKGENTNIKTAVIGDPRQSIYRFRGADPTMMTSSGVFTKKYKAKIFPLNKNYRSSKIVIDAATKLKWQGNEVTDSIEAQSPNEGFIEYYKVKDEIDESRLLSRKISNLIIYGKNGKKYKPSDIAILVRNNYQIDLLAECLHNLHIPFQIAEDMKFFKSDEIIALVSLLKFIGSINIEDKESALQTAFVSPIFSIDPLWLQSVLSTISKNNTTLFNIIEQIYSSNYESIEKLDDDNRIKVIKFSELIKSLMQINEHKVAETIILIINSLLNLLSNPSSTISRNILHIRNMLIDYSEVFKHEFKREPLISDLIPELEEWINYYALNIEPTEEKKSETVKIMTVHQSKGLEFPITVVSGLCDGQFPVNKRESILLNTPTIEIFKEFFIKNNINNNFFNPYPLTEEEQLEEERRLFFVAITRAKEGLILTTPMRVGTDPAVPAPFIKEIGLKADEIEKDDRILTVGEFRTAITGLSQEELLELEPTLIEVEKQIPKEYAIHGIRPRIFNRAQHDQIELPEHFSFSATSLKNYLDCPRKFFFLDILGISDPLESNDTHFIVGNAFHKVLEELHKPGSVWEQAKLPTDEDLFELFEQHAMPMLEAIPFFERYQKANSIKNALLVYRDSLFMNEQLPCRHTKAVEQKFSFNIAGSRITGRFDRIALLNDDSVQIVDYKTSKSTQTSEKVYDKAFPVSGEIADQLELQMPIYLLACQNLGYKNVSAALFYVMSEQYKKLTKGMPAGFQRSAALNLGCGPVYGKDVSTEAIEDFKQRLSDLICKIKTDRTFECNPSTNEDAKTCKNKDGCQFATFCQVGQEIAREKAEREASRK